MEISRLPALESGVQGRHDPVDVPAGARGDVDPRSPLHLDQLALVLPLEVVATLVVDEVPLVERDHQRAARLADGLDDPHVLLGDRLAAVDHEDRHLGALHRGRGAQRGVVLVAGRGLDALADAGGVDEPPGAAAELDELVDRVHGGPGHVVDDHPLLARELVEQGGLPDVRPADDRDPARPADLLPNDSSGVSGSAARIASSMSPDPRPCSAETGNGSPSPRFQSPWASASVRSSSTLFAARTTGRPLLRRTFTTASSASVIPTVASTTNSTASASETATSAWARDALRHAPGIGVPPAGVDDGEGATVPVRVVGDPVSGHPRHVLDDGLASADDPVDQGRLAHVGAPDDGQDRDPCRGPARCRWGALVGALLGRLLGHRIVLVRPGDRTRESHAGGLLGLGERGQHHLADARR